MSSIAVAAGELQAGKTRKAVTAAVVGNLLEWYDFAVYAFVATIIAKKFFPPGDEVTALLSTFLAYGLGIIIGRLGDTRGRKFALLLTIMMMAVGTVLIGILPTYETIGALAPLLLVVARLMQGFSAGGECHAGRHGSLGVARAFPARRHPWPGRHVHASDMDETPAYQEAVKTETHQPVEPSTSPPLAIGRAGVRFHDRMDRLLLRAAQLHADLHAEVPEPQRFGRPMVEHDRAPGSARVHPRMGHLSDRFGRKPLLLACCLAFVVLPYPAFSYLLSSATFIGLVLIQVLFAVLISMFSGAGPAAIAEIFPTKSRSTWMTSGYALAVAIFGGFAPLLSVWLIDRFQSPLAHTFYLIGAAVTSTIVMAVLRETAHEDLR